MKFDRNYADYDAAHRDSLPWIAPVREDGSPYRGGDVILSPELLEEMARFKGELHTRMRAFHAKLRARASNESSERLPSEELNKEREELGVFIASVVKKRFKLHDSNEEATIGHRTGFRAVPHPTEQGPRVVRPLESIDQIPEVDGDFMYKGDFEKRGLQEWVNTLSQKYGPNLENKETLTPYDRFLWGKVNSYLQDETITSLDSVKPLGEWTILRSINDIALRNIAPERQEILVQEMKERLISLLIGRLERYDYWDGRRLREEIGALLPSRKNPYENHRNDWKDQHMTDWENLKSQELNHVLRSWWIERVYKRVAYEVGNYFRENVSLIPGGAFHVEIFFDVDRWLFSIEAAQKIQAQDSGRIQLNFSNAPEDDVEGEQEVNER